MQRQPGNMLDVRKQMHQLQLLLHVLLLQLSSEPSISADNVSAFSNEDDEVTFLHEKKVNINKQSPQANLRV